MAALSLVRNTPAVDRSAVYICRHVAKSVVKNGLSKRSLLQLSCAIGVVNFSCVFVVTCGTKQGSPIADDITNVLKIEFGCRPTRAPKPEAPGDDGVLACQTV